METSNQLEGSKRNLPNLPVTSGYPLGSSETVRHACRRIDIVRMFFNVANAIRLSGRDFFLQTTAAGTVYSFMLGNNVITYSIQKGGVL